MLFSFLLGIKPDSPLNSLTPVSHSSKGAVNYTGSVKTTVSSTFKYPSFAKALEKRTNELQNFINTHLVLQLFLY